MRKVLYIIYIFVQKILLIGEHCLFNIFFVSGLWRYNGPDLNNCGYTVNKSLFFLFFGVLTPTQIQIEIHTTIRTSINMFILKMAQEENYRH